MFRVEFSLWKLLVFSCATKTVPRAFLFKIFRRYCLSTTCISCSCTQRKLDILQCPASELTSTAATRRPVSTCLMFGNYIKPSQNTSRRTWALLALTTLLQAESKGQHTPRKSVENARSTGLGWLCFAYHYTFYVHNGFLFLLKRTNSQQLTHDWHISLCELGLLRLTTVAATCWMTEKAKLWHSMMRNTESDTRPTLQVTRTLYTSLATTRLFHWPGLRTVRSYLVFEETAGFIWGDLLGQSWHQVRNWRRLVGLRCLNYRRKCCAPHCRHWTPKGVSWWQEMPCTWEMLQLFWP